MTTSIISTIRVKSALSKTAGNVYLCSSTERKIITDLRLPFQAKAAAAHLAANSANWIEGIVL